MNTNRVEFLPLGGDEFDVKTVCQPCHALLTPRIEELFRQIREVRALERVVGIEA